MASPKPQKSVSLTPIRRGSGDKVQTIAAVTLRKPVSGELRGLKLLDVIQMDVQTVIKLVPRISEPALTEAEVAAMDPADLAELAIEVAGFLSKDAPSQSA